jgi:spermidine/putrescine transport system ATP-binding protein
MPPSANELSPRGGSLQIQEVRRSFGPVVALNGVSIEVRAGEFFSLLGPSGCGKTTLLRIIAGLDEPNTGAILLDGKDLLRLPAHERPVNTVFQSYALFPHLTVADNIAFGLRMKKTSPAEMKRRVGAMMDLVEVAGLAGRKPHELSGGQRQRVALARALVNEPRVLLLDEPLAAVDQKLRKQLQTDLLALQRRLGLTFIYVTHDQEEALSLSDRLAVMNHGQVEQIGAAQAVYDSPATPFVASFLGGGNFIEAEIAKSLARTSFGAIPVSTTVQGKATVFFRPENVTLGSGSFKGTIERTVFSGMTKHILIRAGDTLIDAAVLNSAGPVSSPGNVISWEVASSAVIVFGADSSGLPLGK